MHYQLLIIGGGAAGLMCAVEAGQRGRRVLVIEHANRVGRKILMSGGGRCNFTNLHAAPENYLSQNPHFCKSALARYTPGDFVAMVDRHRIAWHEKEPGQLFCDESSKLILRMLLDECAAAQVRIEVDCAVHGVKREGAGFRLSTARGEVQADKLVIATGGLSIPKMGATGFGYQLARQFGLGVVPTRAALVPLSLSGAPLQDYAGLAGVSLTVSAHCGAQSFHGGFLFTHRGISGPAVLQISSYWRPGEALRLDLLPQTDAYEFLLAEKAQRPTTQLASVLAERLPRRLVQRLCELRFGNPVLGQMSNARLREISGQLHGWLIVPSGSEGYRTAEVTLGGVDTHELSSITMESRRVPGLYFVGEVIDVTGWLGGYNFQWAWASGVAAGRAV
jgi:predicted Rossmann fold flavoprotein